MNPEILLLLPAAPGAAAVTGAALRWRESRKSAQLIEVLPPEGAQANLRLWSDFFRSLHAIARPRWKRWILGEPWISLELWAAEGSVRTRVWLPGRLEPLVTSQLRSALPGAEIQASDAEFALGHPAVRSRLALARDPLYPLGDLRTEPLAAIVNNLAAAEQAVLQLILMPDVQWESEAGRRLDVLAGIRRESLSVGSIASGVLGSLFDLVLPKPQQPPARRTTSHANPFPPASKAGDPGFRFDLRLRVAAQSTAQSKTRMHAIVAAFRGHDRANTLRPRRVWRGGRFDRELLARRPPGRNAGVLTPPELAGLFHLPVATDALETAPVRIPPPKATASAGKVLCLAELPGSPAVRISQADSLRHISVLGPTGSGKSTLLLNAALDDIRSGSGVGVLDPKGDLVRAVLERIPESEWDRVILIDPSFRDRPIGLNVLECPDPDLYEVVADQVVTIFRKTYERFWGPRTDDILRAALLTLLHHPGSTLCEVPLLLLRPEARADYTEAIDDPVGLEPFWEEYERMPEGTRLQMVGPVLNKLRSVLLRRTVRNMLGQATSTVDLTEAIDRRRIVLISLAKGLLGEDTSRLLGSFFVARIWQAALARAGRPEQWRPDFNLYLDEFQNYLHLPQSLDEVLVEARGYHLGLVLANQHLGQLSSPTREALSANARTRVLFQCGQEDARYLAREFEPRLGERDLRNLQRFQVAIRLCVNGRTEAPFTGMTRPAPPVVSAGHAARLVESALERNGRARADVEAEIEARLAAYRGHAKVRAI